MVFPLKQNRYFLAGVIGFGMGLIGVPAMAAETVVLKYSVFQLAVPISTLETLAGTGETSMQLNTLLKLGKVNPDSVRQVLIQPIPAPGGPLETGLNTLPGQVVLDEVSQVIHTPNREGDREALKTALILSAKDDNRITLLETLQNYPTDEVHLNGERLMDAYKTLANFGKTLSNGTNLLRELLNKIKLPNL